MATPGMGRGPQTSVFSCAPPQALKDGSSGGASGRVPVCAPEEACLHGLLQGAKSTTQGGQVPTSSVSIATPSITYQLSHTPNIPNITYHSKHHSLTLVSYCTSQNVTRFNLDGREAILWLKRWAEGVVWP